MFVGITDIVQNTLFASRWFNVRKIGVAIVTGFDGGYFFDSNCLEVLARLRVFPLARIRVLSRRLFGLILAGLGWWDAGVFAGLFSLLFEKGSHHDCHHVGQGGNSHIGFSCDFAIFSQRIDVSCIQASNSSRREAQFTVVIS